MAEYLLGLWSKQRRFQCVYRVSILGLHSVLLSGPLPAIP